MISGWVQKVTEHRGTIQIIYGLKKCKELPHKHWLILFVRVRGDCCVLSTNFFIPFEAIPSNLLEKFDQPSRLYFSCRIESCLWNSMQFILPWIFFAGQCAAKNVIWGPTEWSWIILTISCKNIVQQKFFAIQTVCDRMYNYSAFHNERPKTFCLILVFSNSTCYWGGAKFQLFKTFTRYIFMAYHG